MTTLNVQNYGAVGDGSTDDTAAIQQAIDDAGDGDTVYFPESSPSYIVSGAHALVISQPIPADLTLEGAGEGTVIEYAGGNGGRNTSVLRVDPRNNDVRNTTIRNMVIDGNSSAVDGDPNVAGGILVQKIENDNNYTYDMTIEDVRIEDAYGNGFDVFMPGVTVRDCSAIDIGQHGFGADTETSSVPYNHSPIVFKRCLSDGASQRGGGFYNFDASGGRVDIIDCVGVNSSTHGIKTTRETFDTTIERTRIDNPAQQCFIRPPNDSIISTVSEVTFSDVVFSNAGDQSMRLSQDTVYHFENDVICTGSNGGNHNDVWFSGESGRHQGAELDTSAGRLFISNSANSNAVVYHSNESSTLGPLDRHSTGGISNNGNLRIHDEGSVEKTDLDNVPTVSDVGAWTNSDSTDDSDNTEDDTDDSSDDTTDDSEFEAWTPQWDADARNWSVVSGNEYEGGHALQFKDESTDLGRRAISWDAAGTPADVEVLDKFRVPEFDDDETRGYYARVHLRSSYADGEELGYWVEMEEPAGGFRLGKYRSDGGLTTMARWGTPRENAFFYRRFRAEGDRLQVKVWETTEPEPDTWDVDVTDADHADGWVGLGSFDPTAVETDVLGVATDGGTVQLESENTQPTVSWRGPADGETVEQNVAVRLDAADGTGSSEGVTVEYRADDGPWMATTYNAESDTHEAMWDSTDVDNGDVSLAARATSDDGSTAGATVSVTVDNRPDVVSLEARDLTTETATLAGDLRSLGGSDEVRVRFELRPGNMDAWTTVGGETLDSPAEFTHIVSGLDPDDAYEFRAVADGADATVHGATISFTTLAAPDENRAPAIDQFEVTDRSDKKWTRFDIDWNVSDEDGDLDAAVTTLERNGRTVAAKTTTISGESASYTHVLRVRGMVDTVTLTVSDTSNATAHREHDV